MRQTRTSAIVAQKKDVTTRSRRVSPSNRLLDKVSGGFTFGKNQFNALIPFIIAIAVGIAIVFGRFIFASGKKRRR